MIIYSSSILHELDAGSGTLTSVHQMWVLQSIIKIFHVKLLLNELSTSSVFNGKFFVSDIIQVYDIGTKIKMN